MKIKTNPKMFRNKLNTIEMLRNSSFEHTYIKENLIYFIKRPLSGKFISIRKCVDIKSKLVYQVPNIY